ncbi:hypothetical protein APHAL10511_006995 [Amanita phalloides]|nr:hypothetical protein APHAL10511_006995 [Amanita phalloides]
MSSTLFSDRLVTDDLTILLGLVAATVFLLNNLYKPQPLVHPILLGRQSDVGRARNAGESAIYRNYSTGLMGRFPVRPNKDVNVLADLVKVDVEGARTLWHTKITNSNLQDRAAALATGLVRLAGLLPKKSRVVMLMNDGIEFILSDLALASLSIVSYTVSSAAVLSLVFDQHPTSAIITNAGFVPRLLTLIYRSKLKSSHMIIIAIGEVSHQVTASVPNNVQLLRFSDIEKDGYRTERVLVPLPRNSDAFSVSFEELSGELQATKFTHENVTAGVAATRALLPASNALSALDTVVSAYSLNTVYGRVVAYTAIYEGTSFATLSTAWPNVMQEQMVDDLGDAISYKKCPIPSPTVLFVRTRHLETLVSQIHEEASRSSLYPLAIRHKKASIAEGFISKESLWDRLVFDGARAKIIGEGAGTLRCVIVSGGKSNPLQSRTALSVPLINCFTHGAVAGPVLASHPFDLQDLPTSGFAHMGPPSVNVEVKLIGVDDSAIEKGGDPVGVMIVRGPSVGTQDGTDDGWLSTGIRFRVQANGAFQAV